MKLSERILRMPRYLDVPWAVIAVVGMVWALAHSDGVPLSSSSVSQATASIAFCLRVELTCWRIRRGVSSLCPLIDRIYVVIHGDKP